MKKQLFFWILMLAGISGFAQDHMYSQFFNSPVYLNPALNGQFEGDLRMNMIYRNQWTSIPGNGFKYLTASIDYNIPKFGGGIGLLFNRSTEGSAYLTTNNIAGIYSYSVGSESYILSFGLQAGISNRTIDWSKLVFNDQIDPTLGYIGGSVSAAETPAFSNRFYFDSGAGINLVAGNFMAGGAVQHINQPDVSFSGAKSRLPLRYTGHLSYRLDLNAYDNVDEDQKSFVIPSVVIYKESVSSSIAAGLQYKRRSINVGMWYRSSGQGGPSALVLSLIFDFPMHEGGEKMRLGVSHDVPTSKLNYSNTSGTSEGSVDYETTLPSRADAYHKFEGTRRCYDFY